MRNDIAIDANFRHACQLLFAPQFFTTTPVAVIVSASSGYFVKRGRSGVRTARKPRSPHARLARTAVVREQFLTFLAASDLQTVENYAEKCGESYAKILANIFIDGSTMRRRTSARRGYAEAVYR